MEDLDYISETETVAYFGAAAVMSKYASAYYITRVEQIIRRLTNG